MAEISGFMEVVLPFRIPDLANTDLGSHCLQLTIPVNLTGKAIQGVVRENEFDNILPEFLNTGRTGINVLAFGHRSMAGRHGFHRTVLLRSHFNTADSAGSKRIEIRGVAQGGNETGICFPANKG
jgi:hypothetical protein